MADVLLYTFIGRTAAFQYLCRRSLFLKGMSNCAHFSEHGGVKGGRCRVLLLPFFKTAHWIVMET